MKFHDFHDFLGFRAPGRLLAPLVQVAARIPYYFIPQDSLFRGEGRGGLVFQGLLSSDSSPLLQVVEALIQSSLLYGAETTLQSVI